jgi:hypothetical protein
MGEDSESRFTYARQSTHNLDVSKLLELGMSTQFVSTLDPTQMTDLVKGLVYLSEKYLFES